jgi:hypothetical protein
MPLKDAQKLVKHSSKRLYNNSYFVKRLSYCYRLGIIVILYVPYSKKNWYSGKRQGRESTYLGTGTVSNKYMCSRHPKN